MSDVKRYTPDPDIGVFPADDGGLVKWEDYDAVVSELEALKARLAHCKETLRWIADEGLSCGDYAACVREARAALRATDSAPACPICHGTGWKEASDVYADGSYSTSRPCPRGCADPTAPASLSEFVRAAPAQREIIGAKVAKAVDAAMPCLRCGGEGTYPTREGMDRPCPDCAGSTAAVCP